ncbi:MAG: hypothetical protein J6D30_04815 [Clostridia bacterium]|nr:hypothetical protein [Clostridia bacterium]
MTREMMKERALELLTKLGVHRVCTYWFGCRNEVLLWEDGHLGYIGGNLAMERLRLKIKEIEEQFGCLIYGVTHEYFEFGECYSLLFVSQYSEDWSVEYATDGKVHRVYAYCWNVDREECSEIGSVYLESRNGGVVRVG